MSNNNELFPFPAASEDDQQLKSQEVALPPFPGTAEPALTDQELRALRKMLAAYNAGQAAAAMPEIKDELPEISLPAAPVNNPGIAKDDGFAAIWSQLRLTDPIEVEALATFKDIFAEVHAGDDLLKVFWSLASVFPIKKFLRIGTPEQKLFALNVLGDRFLQGLAGFAHPVRKKLLKAVSKYFSGVAEGYSFLSMENEPFNLQYHERVPGASAAGKAVREMHGFLVVARDSNRVVRLGQVLT